MKKESVHAIVSKMIINEELMASLDEPSECMVMHRTEPTRLQSLSLQLSDKISQLVENNERLLELRPGGKNYVFKRGKYLIGSQFFSNGYNCLAPSSFQSTTLQLLRGTFFLVTYVGN
jgi:hypothetical protein